MELNDRYNGDVNESLADVISNLVGVFITLIMLSFLFIGPMTQKWFDEDKPEDIKDVFYRSTKRQLFRPFDEIYIIAYDTIIKWDIESIISVFANNTNKSRIHIQENGRYTLYDNEFDRDIDLFTFEYKIDWSSFRKNNKQINNDTLDEMIGIIINESKSNKRSVTFIVFPSGMDVFSKIYNKIFRKKILFRWITQMENDPITIGRWPEQYNDETFLLN